MPMNIHDGGEAVQVQSQQLIVFVDNLWRIILHVLWKTLWKHMNFWTSSTVNIRCPDFNSTTQSFCCQACALHMWTELDLDYCCIPVQVIIRTHAQHTILYICYSYLYRQTLCNVKYKYPSLRKNLNYCMDFKEASHHQKVLISVW